MEQAQDVFQQIARRVAASKSPTGIPTSTPKRLSDEERREQLAKRLNISNLNNTFENFKARPGTERMVEAFRAFATDDTAAPFIGLYGGNGNGKTHMLEACSIEFYRRGIFARVVPFADVWTLYWRAIHKETMLSFEEISLNMCRAPVLLLDDVGQGLPDNTNRPWEILDTIIGRRYHDCMKTALVTNLPFEKMPERIVSRFTDKQLAVLILNKGEDYRPKKEVKNG